jgi:hypothetical protein
MTIEDFDKKYSNRIYLNTLEVLEALPVSRSYIEEMVKNGRLTRFKIAGRTNGKSLYSCEEIRELVKPHIPKKAK